MFALFALRTAKRLGGLSLKRPKLSRVEDDVRALLARMRQRQYPETIPVLASYWLKTVYTSGYARHEWKAVSDLLKHTTGGGLVEGPALAPAALEALSEIQNWIEDTFLRNCRSMPAPTPRFLEPVRPGLRSERLAPYIIRLLNEWVPVEVARMPPGESESEVQSSGIPVLVFGNALERLLAREHLSRGTLEMLAEPGGISLEHVYPAHSEILRDVVLSLLGRTQAPVPNVLPAAPLYGAPQSCLGADYGEAIRDAFLVKRAWGEEVRVPVSPEQLQQILQQERVRTGSVIVTMDGRWWETENLLSAKRFCIFYRPGGRLRIDYSGRHATLRVPWPERVLRWSGGCDSGDRFKIFGREWRVTKYEVDGERTWLHLELFRMLPVSELIPGAGRGAWKLRPASVDMAWTSLGSALANSLAQNNSEPIERLRHSELIPLGRALMRFTQSLLGWRPQRGEALETHLRALRYLQGPVLTVYGGIPWRILPRPARAKLLKICRDPAIVALMSEVLEGMPEVLENKETALRAAAK